MAGKPSLQLFMILRQPSGPAPHIFAIGKIRHNRQI
jgi:hypothetical protein